VLIIGLTVGLLNGFPAGHTSDQVRGLAIIGALVAAVVAGREVWEQSTWGHPVVRALLLTIAGAIVVMVALASPTWMP
jgi:hypothetical protein